MKTAFIVTWAACLYGMAAWFNPQEAVGAWLHEVAADAVEALPRVPFSGLLHWEGVRHE